MSGIDGKVALVTGATGGIGLCICKSLAKLGAHIVVVDLNQEKCEELAEALPTKSLGLSINIADDAAVKAGMETVEAEFPDGVDILVNVAGILSNNKMVETSAAEWRKVMAVNVDGAFYMTQACVPAMLKKKWGRIVNMSSWAWKSGGLTAGTAYSTSKAAITGLTFSTARQYAGDGITANGIAPCYVMSKMVSEQLSVSVCRPGDPVCEV